MTGHELDIKCIDISRKEDVVAELDKEEADYIREYDSISKAKEYSRHIRSVEIERARSLRYYMTAFIIGCIVAVVVLCSIKMEQLDKKSKLEAKKEVLTCQQSGFCIYEDTFETLDGNIWKFYDSGFVAGDIVTITFDITNGEDITEREIISIGDYPVSK